MRFERFDRISNDDPIEEKVVIEKKVDFERGDHIVFIKELPKEINAQSKSESPKKKPRKVSPKLHKAAVESVQKKI